MDADAEMVRHGDDMSLAGSETRLSDGGMRYAETDLARFPVEPWNAVSALAFGAVAWYLVRKTRLRLFRHPLPVLAILPLLLGMVFGMGFHATRGHPAWRTLDFLTIFYVVVMVCIYLWYRVTGGWLLAACLTLSPLLLCWCYLVMVTPTGRTIPQGIVYALLSLVILVPAVLHCLQRRLAHLDQLCLATLAFAVAMFFREMDLFFGRWLPMGTHWLWHLGGAASGFFFARYLLRTGEDRAPATVPSPRK